MEATTARRISANNQLINELRKHLNRRILGQRGLVTKILVALVADGHLLVEGVPGLAKTKAIKELAAGIEGNFHRIQFTPDLLPADLTGTDVYRPTDGSFQFQPGPVFHNLILADEINRAPAKVQSALLEAMGEQQVTVGMKTYPLPELFLVMATQNPLEQEGTYPLPEAQLDRFLMRINVDYPDAGMEQNILNLARDEARQGIKQAPLTKPIVSQRVIFESRQEVLDVFLSPALEQYLVQIIIATRNPKAYNSQLAQWIRYGASPRATIALDRCARAHAWLHGRDYVSPDDVQQVVYDVLRHRLILSFEAEAEAVTIDEVITQLLQYIPIP